MEGSSSVRGALPESIAPLERKLNDHIYQLYKAKGEPTLEILFFHGLQVGHGVDAYRSTWTSGYGLSQQVWPATWLAEEFPDSHIFSMSYDSRLDLHNLAENLMHAITWGPGIGQRCPVILVGHSFGGLVIKALCVKADQTYSRDSHSETNKKIGKFLHNTVGFFFYATPHQGIHSVGKLGAYLLDGPNDGRLLDYVKLLSANSARLDDDFCHVRQKYKVWHIASAGESRPTSWRHFNDLVVPEASARYGDQFTMIEADHISICKPSRKTANSFQHLINFITMVQKAMLRLEDEDQVTFGTSRPFSTHFSGGWDDFMQSLSNAISTHFPGLTLEQYVESLSKDNMPSLQEQGALALANLACNDRDMKLKIVNFPMALEKLVQCMSKDKDSHLRKETARAFIILTSGNHETKLKIVNFPGALEELVQSLSEDNNPNIQKQGAGALSNLANGDHEIKLKIVNFPGALEELVQSLSKDNNPDLQEQGARALSNLANGDHETKLKIVSFPRALEKLVQSLSKNNNQGLQEQGAWALVNLACGDHEIRLRIMSFPQALKKLALFLSEKSDPNVQFHVARTLTLLNQTLGNDACLHTSQAYSGRGQANLRLGGYQKALADFDKAIELHPQTRNHSTWSNRCTAKAKLGDFQGALIDANRAIKIERSAFHLQQRGVVKEMMGDLLGALADLNEGLDMETDDYESLKHRGFIKFLLLDEEGARVDAEWAHKIKPSSVDNFDYGRSYLGASSVEYLDYKLR